MLLARLQGLGAPERELILLRASVTFTECAACQAPRYGGDAEMRRNPFSSQEVGPREGC